MGHQWDQIDFYNEALGVQPAEHEDDGMQDNIEFVNEDLISELSDNKFMFLSVCL